MATDEPTPAPCNPEIFQKGESVAALDAMSNAAERWVRAVAAKAKARVDWHYSGGIANVLHLGDEESRKRVEAAIDELASTLDGRIMKRYQASEPGRYRNLDSGTTEATVVRDDNGNLVLIDPVATAVMQTVSKHNCGNMLELNAERVEYFKGRMAARSLTANQVVIVLLNVDDVHGGPIADSLMPGQDWQAIRDAGQVPIARGMADRAGIGAVLSQFDAEAAKKLQDMAGVTVVVVVDHGVAEIFAV